MRLYNDRQEKILDLLHIDGNISLNQLHESFPEVSTMTLRRDLILLEKEGHLVRTRGGAISISKTTESIGEETLYTFRASENIDAKKSIANKASTFLEKGRAIYLDSGSTLMCLAKILHDDTYTIITSGVNIALELIKKTKPSVVTLGGQVNRNTISVSGPNALSLIDSVNIDIAFISASGFTTETGFSVSNVYESELKRKVIKKAKKSFVLIDSSKFDKNLAFTFATLDDIDMIITEKKPSKDMITFIQSHNVKIL